jgi:ABC-type sugar transport system permease subunit
MNQLVSELKLFARSRSRVKISPHLRSKFLWSYLFILPQALMFLAFTIWPMIANIYFSFYNWSGIGWPDEFVGLSNYREVWQDSYFWNAFRNSLIYTVSLVVIVVPLSLLLALALNSPRLKGAVFFRTMFFIPVVSTMAIIGIVMRFIFAERGGMINGLLQKMHLIDAPVGWLSDGKTAMIALILVGAWKGFGIKVVYWLAGLQSLPKSIYEAAKVDGATQFQMFRYITLPLMIPFLILISFFQMIWAFNVFDLVKTFTNGGPYFGTDVVPLYIYRNSFLMQGGLPRMGYASAASLFYGITVMTLSLVLGLGAKNFRSRKSSRLQEGD